MHNSHIHMRDKTNNLIHYGSPSSKQLTKENLKMVIKVLSEKLQVIFGLCGRKYLHIKLLRWSDETRINFRSGPSKYCISSFAVVWGNVLWEKKINLSYGSQKNHTIPIMNYFSIELNKYT